MNNKVKTNIIKENTEPAEMIVAIINRGYSDFVIDASRDAGATGATILYGRSSFNTPDDEINGTHLQTEKEVVLILVKKSIRKKVMLEISRRTHLQEKGNGMCFCLPVSEVAGNNFLNIQDNQ